MVSDTGTTAVTVFVKLEREKRTLEEDLKRCKEKMNALQDQILDDWADQGVQSIKVGGFNVHVRNDFICSKRGGVATDAVCASLMANGLGSLVGESYSASALKSRIKEMVADDQVPEDLGQLLRYETIPRLIAVRG